MRNESFHAFVMLLCDRDGSRVSLKNDELASCSSHVACTQAQNLTVVLTATALGFVAVSMCFT